MCFFFKKKNLILFDFPVGDAYLMIYACLPSGPLDKYKAQKQVRKGIYTFTLHLLFLCVNGT